MQAAGADGERWMAHAMRERAEGSAPRTTSAGERSDTLPTMFRKLVVVEDEEQLDKVLRVRAQLPGLRRIVIFDMEGLADFSDPMALSLGAFMELGADHDRRNPGLWERRLGEPRPDELAILVYTSGTTGPPK